MQSHECFISYVSSKVLNHSCFPLNISVSFLNPYSYCRMRRSLQYLACFDFLGIDGFLLSKLLSIFLKKKILRLSFDFTSLADDIFSRASFEARSVYFVGATKDDICIFVKKIENRYPELKISGFSSGYFKNLKSYYETLDNIIKLNPDIVVVGMGSPLQEEFVTRLKFGGWSGSAWTCGGFIHQTAISASLEYYPYWINKLNLRWLFRMVKEPRTIKRYIFSYPWFFLVFLFDAASYSIAVRKKRQTL